LVAALESTAAAHANNLALVDGDRTFTNAECAQRLVEHG
jgi:hypothetical protein